MRTNREVMHHINRSCFLRILYIYATLIVVLSFYFNCIICYQYSYSIHPWARDALVSVYCVILRKEYHFWDVLLLPFVLVYTRNCLIIVLLPPVQYCIHYIEKILVCLDCYSHLLPPMIELVLSFQDVIGYILFLLENHL